MGTTSQILLAIFLANFHEWWIHKFVLHGLGKDKDSKWNFHWKHHQTARKNGYLDSQYLKNGYPKERLSLILLMLVHSPLFFFYPVMAKTLAAYLVIYYFAHARMHIDPIWGMKHFPWHYDHHMGPDQDKNWCIVIPLCDIIFRTREKYFRSTKF